MDPLNCSIEPQNWDRLFVGFRLLTMREGADAYGLLDDHALAVKDGVIVWIGPQTAVDTSVVDEVVQGDGLCLSPALIDCHTHVVFGGNRAREWEQRLEGVSYEQIAREGGGIQSTVRATREANEAVLLDSALGRLTALLNEGVATVEVKSGYGLSTESELKMLRVANQLSTRLPINVTTTFLGAHCVPAEYTGREDEYIRRVCDEMLPAAAPLCQAVDGILREDRIHGRSDGGRFWRPHASTACRERSMPNSFRIREGRFWRRKWELFRPTILSIWTWRVSRPWRRIRLSLPCCRVLFTACARNKCHRCQDCGTTAYRWRWPLIVIRAARL